MASAVIPPLKLYSLANIVQLSPLSIDLLTNPVSVPQYNTLLLLFETSKEYTFTCHGQLAIAISPPVSLRKKVSLGPKNSQLLSDIIFGTI